MDIAILVLEDTLIQQRKQLEKSRKAKERDKQTNGNPRHQIIYDKSIFNLKSFIQELEEAITILKANQSTPQKDNCEGEIQIKFILKLNIDEWGTYKKGDTEEFFINVFDEQNGLVRFPIDKRWDIVSKEIVRVDNEIDVS